MMEHRNKFAFTIAEAIITFTLIGVIFVLTISNIRPNVNYYKLYWQAFNTLYQASKAMYDEWESELSTSCPYCSSDSNSATCYKAECWRNSKVQNCDGCQTQERSYLGGTDNIDRDFPGFLFNNNINNALAGIGQDIEFCTNLISRINTFPSERCKSFISTYNSAVITNNNAQGGKKFLEAFAYIDNSDDNNGGGSDDSNKKTSNNTGITPSFIALNGQKFYISSVVTANAPKKLGPAWDKFDHPSRQSYRFVVVDLNGDTKPNSQFKTNAGDPDIVLFAINSMGDVIPLGLPEFSKAYINAVVYYPNDLNEDGTRVYQNIKSKPMSLWAAKSYAWGNETCGGGANPLPYGSAVSEYEPLSQSARFYAVAAYCKGNTKDCSLRNIPEDEVYADELFTNLVLQFLFKAENSTELYPYLTKSECIYNSAENGCMPIASENEAPFCAIDFEH